MPTHHGINVNTIYPQAGFSPNRDEKGGWTAAQVYKILRAAWSNEDIRALFARGVSILTIEPTLEPFWAFLKVTGMNVLHEEGDHVSLAVSFSGAQSPQYSGDEDLGDGSIPIYRLEGRMAEAPFSDHEKFKALDDDEQKALGGMINGNLVYRIDGDSGEGIYEAATGFFYDYDQISTADGISFRDLIAKGQTTYVFPTVTWTETTQGTSQLTGGQLNKLGKISTPRGSAPTPTGGRNWMLTGASQEQAGELFQTTLEWTLSDKDGHSSFLYSA